MEAGKVLYIDYGPAGRPYIRNDPLYSADADELNRYLSYCQKSLVRIDMLTIESGRWLDREAEVADAMCMLFKINSPSCPTVQKVAYDDRV